MPINRRSPGLLESTLTLFATCQPVSVVPCASCTPSSVLRSGRQHTPHPYCCNLESPPPLPRYHAHQRLLPSLTSLTRREMRRPQRCGCTSAWGWDCSFVFACLGSNRLPARASGIRYVVDSRIGVLVVVVVLLLVSVLLTVPLVFLTFVVLVVGGVVGVLTLIAHD